MDPEFSEGGSESRMLTAPGFAEGRNKAIGYLFLVLQ